MTATHQSYVYFWSKQDPKYACFSQWYQTEFEEDNVIFNCSEQYMMAKKALLFKDTSIYNKIMNTDSPPQMKRLGRKVKNFDHKIWEKERYSIVYCGNMLKFGSNIDILSILQNTGNDIIAEASPYDKIWGIGVKKSKSLTSKDWKGLNLLGQILMEVRNDI